jgi:hypothetical protein
VHTGVLCKYVLYVSVHLLSTFCDSNITVFSALTGKVLVVVNAFLTSIVYDLLRNVQCYTPIGRNRTTYKPVWEVCIHLGNVTDIILCVW